MIIIIICFILLVIGFCLWKFFDDFFEFSGIFLMASSACVLAIMLIIWPISYYTGEADVAKYNAIKQSIENSRQQQISDVERATITTQIIAVNKDLASTKYWNKTSFDWFIYDGYANLDYLK